MRIAIVHYWFVAERGGEKVVRALCDLFPRAVLFAHVADKRLMERLYPGHEIRTTFVSRLPFAARRYKSYLPLMPMALEELDLREFDLVISSESGPAKGVIPAPQTRHLCYCHSPMRYIWDQYREYRDAAGFPVSWAMPFLAHRLRQWDVTSAARVDRFVANSRFVASRIEKYYRRSSTVIHPPVDVSAFRRGAPGVERDPDLEDAYLWVGQLTAYKRPDAAIEAFNRLGRKLIVIGDGEESRMLKAKARDNIVFLGRADGAALKRAYASCRALVFPGEEDFGLVPVEAMASGLPVIALGRGGALDSVKDGVTGVLYNQPGADGLVAGVERFENDAAQFDPDAIVRHAETFDVENFKASIAKVIAELAG